MGKMDLKEVELFSDDSNMTNRYDYPSAIQDLQNNGYLSLDNIQKLSRSDLECLCEEIKFWCIYGNQDLSKLKAQPRTEMSFISF